MSDPLDVKPEVRRRIEELVALGRGRFDEFDAECAENALLMFDRAATEVRRLQAELEKVTGERNGWNIAAHEAEEKLGEALTESRADRETIWAERELLAEVMAERDAALARLEKARGLVLEFAANMGPGFFDSYPTLVKLRAALTGTEGPP